MIIGESSIFERQAQFALTMEPACPVRSTRIHEGSMAMTEPNRRPVNGRGRGVDKCERRITRLHVILAGFISIHSRKDYASNRQLEMPSPSCLVAFQGQEGIDLSSERHQYPCMQVTV